IIVVVLEVVVDLDILAAAHEGLGGLLLLGEGIDFLVLIEGLDVVVAVFFVLVVILVEVVVVLVVVVVLIILVVVVLIVFLDGFGLGFGGDGFCCRCALGFRRFSDDGNDGLALGADRRMLAEIVEFRPAFGAGVLVAQVSRRQGDIPMLGSRACHVCARL